MCDGSEEEEKNIEGMLDASVPHIVNCKVQHFGGPVEWVAHCRSI